MCTHAAPTLRFDIEAEWTTPDKSPWESEPSYRYTLQEETSTGWKALEEASGFNSTVEAAYAAAQALRLRTTTTAPDQEPPN